MAYNPQKYLRYSGEFLSIAGVCWRVELWQDSDRPFVETLPLRFPAEEPLIIEWPETARHEVLCSSIATLKVVSEYDREFYDLYSEEPGSVRLDVYRNGLLYWSGTLDTEFYTEPYERADLYDVSLTFGDFGILDRLHYEGEGMQSLSDIMTEALNRSGISHEGISTHISTAIGEGGEPMTLADLQVSAANFYDEAGEAMTLREVLVGVLTPLALRIQQRAGRVYVYDLNALYNLPEAPEVVRWSSITQDAGTAGVYNDIEVTFSPYTMAGNLLPEKIWTQEVDPNHTAINDNSPQVYESDSKCFTEHCSTAYAQWDDSNRENRDAGFSLWISDKGAGASLNGAQFYKLIPLLDGTESEGVCVVHSHSGKTHNGDVWNSTYTLGRNGDSPSLISNAWPLREPIITTKKVWLPPGVDHRAVTFRLTLPLLLSCRFNPFENAANLGDIPCADWEALWKEKLQFVYVPVVVKFQPDGTDTIYAWSNDSHFLQHVADYSQVSRFEWASGWRIFDHPANGAPNTYARLAYYDPSMRTAGRDGNTPFGKQFLANRPCIPPTAGEYLPSNVERAVEGEEILYPSYEGRALGAGNIWVEVYKGGWVFSTAGCDPAVPHLQVRGDDELNLELTEGYVPGVQQHENPANELWGVDGQSTVQWVLFQPPRLELMRKAPYYSDIDTDDVVYQATINAAAAERLSISTVCGTPKNNVCTARGAYFDASGNIVRAFTRAGRTAKCEELLIGTCYSQYARRRYRFSGEAWIDPDGLKLRRDLNAPGVKLLTTGERCNLYHDVADSVFVEIRPDEYRKA